MINGNEINGTLLCLSHALLVAADGEVLHDLAAVLLLIFVYPNILGNSVNKSPA